jgi:hypothetical protein
MPCYFLLMLAHFFINKMGLPLSLLPSIYNASPEVIFIIINSSKHDNIITNFEQGLAHPPKIP